MIRIGLTGGVASGKSTALSILKDLGCFVFSSDDIAHKIYERNNRAIASIKTNFGCVDANGVVNRLQLGKIIFNDAKSRNKLENLIHPVVKSVRREFFKISEKKGALFAVCETPLLFEKNLIGEFEYSILIVAGLDVRVERFLRDKNRSQDDFFKIAKNQMLDSKKASLADFVVKNNGSKEMLRQQLETVLKDIKKKH